MTRIYMTKNGKTIHQDIKNNMIERWTDLCKANGFKITRVASL